MERPVGEKFVYNGVTLEVVEHQDCLGCYFHKNYIRCNNTTIREAIGACEDFKRNDLKNIIFKEAK